MKIANILTSIGVILALALAGCGGGGGDATEGGDGADTAGGEVPAEYQGAIASTDVEGGQALYEQACNTCHAGGAPTLDGIGWSAAKVRQQIREGEGSMPPIPESRLSAEDMESVLAYMQTIGAVSE